MTGEITDPQERYLLRLAGQLKDVTYRRMSQVPKDVWGPDGIPTTSDDAVRMISRLQQRIAPQRGR